MTLDAAIEEDEEGEGGEEDEDNLLGRPRVKARQSVAMASNRVYFEVKFDFKVEREARTRRKRGNLVGLDEEGIASGEASREA